jgi:hypothetical protein
MSYRDASEILRERLREVDRALGARASASETLRDEEERLREERRTLDGELRKRRVLPMLDDVRVASPCSESWSEMSGDDRKRFCEKCEKNVYDLSAMTRQEAEVFLAMQEGSVCVRFYRRFDGTILTSDCPEGVKRRRRRRVAAVAVMAAGVGMAASLVMNHRSIAVQGDISAPMPNPVQGQTTPYPGVMGSVSPISPAVIGTVTAVPETRTMKAPKTK